MDQGKSCRVREETIERYATGKLKGSSLGRFEEHLLVCAECQGRTEAADLYIAAMKRALEALAAAPADERRSEPRQLIKRAITVNCDGRQTLIGRTIDVSPSGLGMTLKVKVALGERVMLASNGHNYRGEVAWCAPNGSSYRVGVRLCA